MSNSTEKACITASIDEKHSSEREVDEPVQDIETIARLRRENRRNRWAITIYLLILFTFSAIPRQVRTVACHWRCTSVCQNDDSTICVTTRSHGPKGFNSEETFWSDWHDIVFLRRCLTLIVSCIVGPAMLWLVARSVYPDLRSDGSPIMVYPRIEERIGRALRWTGRSIWTSVVLFMALTFLVVSGGGLEVISSEISKYGKQHYGCDWPETGWFLLDDLPDLLPIWVIQFAIQMIANTIRGSETKARPVRKLGNELDESQSVDVKAPIESA